MGEVSSEICSYICLQEVSALDALIDVTRTDSEAGSLKEFQASNPSSDLHDYLIFGSKNLESHLAQVILLDRDWVDHISLSFSFGRGIGVVLVVGVVVCACACRSEAPADTDGPAAVTAYTEARACQCCSNGLRITRSCVCG